MKTHETFFFVDVVPLRTFTTKLLVSSAFATPTTRSEHSSTEEELTEKRREELVYYATGNTEVYHQWYHDWYTSTLHG